MWWTQIQAHMWRSSKRALSSASRRSAPARFGIAFDIDGVLIRGGQKLPSATQVLDSLQRQHVPHLFLTNGGGCMEEEKAKTLSHIVDCSIHPEQMILSHTPMRELATTFGDKRVLIMGSHDVWRVAKSYGFQKVVSVEDLLHHHPTQYPFLHYDQRSAPHHDEPIEAIIVMHDPIHWAPDIQFAVDVLIGGDPPGSACLSNKQTPLFVSNDDFVFSGAYPFPRFAQGIPCFFFRLVPFLISCLASDLNIEANASFWYAQNRLNTISGHSVPLKRIYGIGDNPLSDIQGANNAGGDWTSILVRTGIFDGSKDPEHEPDVIVDGVGDAIKYIYKCEGIDDSML
ncbi:hypothetical protein PsorP6_016230 [Peronosclerospora sorghi]|uniref:Uncharacterized protein n=1 Tax=Peronosclerospora sorghi TaxID=230839 RepID=A0ACC0VPX8_9STRA|nr:hypothetical protein PsorP6_016230 [Peronosclerospora sorghi]